jgi:hypothetical protein
MKRYFSHGCYRILGDQLNLILAYGCAFNDTINQLKEWRPMENENSVKVKTIGSGVYTQGNCVFEF